MKNIIEIENMQNSDEALEIKKHLDYLTADIGDVSVFDNLIKKVFKEMDE